MTTFDATRAREHLVRALEADLIGPYDLPEAGRADMSEELLRIPPSRWYLTGFLAPTAERVVEETEEELAAGPDDPTEASAPVGARRAHFLPSSIGLSVLLPESEDEATDRLVAHVAWADYVAEVQTIEDEDGQASKQTFWRRVPQPPRKVELPLLPQTLARGLEVPGAPGVWLVGRVAPADAPGLPHGARAVAVFLVNRRGSGPRGRIDEHFLFQARLEVEYERGFLARPDRRGEGSADGDEAVADLQFRDNVEWAVGHGVATRATVEKEETSRIVRRASTTWIPRAEVPRVAAHAIEDLEIRMESLATLDSAESVHRALERLPADYGTWIDEQAKRDEHFSDERKATRDRLVRDARRARDRIAGGIELLASEQTVREAFCRMNRIMVRQARRQRPGQEPRWRLFQLAFVLLNLPSIADPQHPDRERVELIYFPTGGGKTEAYLGVIATALLLRRLRGTGRVDGGDGVAVILRYTLRLLTLDQLKRAATLICALELERRAQPDRLGATRFAVGLWVGRTATANTLQQVAQQIREYKDSRGNTADSPFPLTECPWCGTEIERDSLTLLPDRRNPESVRVTCTRDDCAFHVDNSPDGLPVLFVDEQIYRELPAFLIATVDKFAMLPWRGETGMLFGRAHWRLGRRFYGPLDGRVERDGRRLPEGLRPPELIVQDELHLISGPLGTMVGLYETVVEALCERPADGPTGEGRTLRPKVIAATATVRQATQQIRALFGRGDAPAVFPPPGIDDGETFFATIGGGAGRLYVGVASPGRAMKALLLRTYLVLLAAGQRLWESRDDGEQARNNIDAYMTLVGYFNSLRELGGMRRLVEDEVVSRVAKLCERRPENGDPTRWFADRRLRPEPLELTSRETTARIADTKARLDRAHGSQDAVDVLLASNMISVGVDISRLGLMVVAGQPKTTAEYIQASSRVGRQPEVAPGLVVTCLNVHKARDRSHYEHFTGYHESFYRDVEASSVTPFSAPALERGLAGALLALTRLAEVSMTPNAAAAAIRDRRELAEAAVHALKRRAGVHRSHDAQAVQRLEDDLQAMARRLVDTWERVVAEAERSAGGRTYSPYDRDKRGGRALLHTVLDDDRPPPHSDDARFHAPTSMRDVEPTVHLWLQRQPLGGHNP
ncbi:MAG: DISARM system helicase DrmA [Acidobacteriota bacterium]